jgi:hypothetical protein
MPSTRHDKPSGWLSHSPLTYPGECCLAYAGKVAMTVLSRSRISSDTRRPLFLTARVQDTARGHSSIVSGGLSHASFFPRRAARTRHRGVSPAPRRRPRPTRSIASNSALAMTSPWARCRWCRWSPRCGWPTWWGNTDCEAAEAWREFGARALPHLGAEDAERLRGLLD